MREKNIYSYIQLTIWAFGLFLAQNVAAAEISLPAKTSTAIFAGGCFWCMEPPYDALAGVLSTTSGYTGGDSENPTYKEVSEGLSGHYESVKVIFNPARISYSTLLNIFWQNIDPFDDTGQFCDKGKQYKAVIFYQDEEQKQFAEASKESIMRKFQQKSIVTTIQQAGKFYPAEDYHQNYYIKNPIRYKIYRTLCKRDRRLHQIWGN